MMFQENISPEYARTVDDINDASTTQKGVRLAVDRQNRNMRSRMSLVSGQNAPDAKRDKGSNDDGRNRSRKSQAEI